jgi:competence/damage-inducible protein CinA-like protein
LRGLGIDLYRTQTVGDNAARIAGVIHEALQRADIVITTGGLGPTVDDPTRQAIADAAGMKLEFHPELWEQIAARIGRYGRTPTENQKRQAYIPKGAIVIENPVGTAPAFIVEVGAKAIITLPGVPSEMETLLTDTVVPYLQKHFNLHEIIKVRTLHISGLGEGMIDDKVGDLEELANPTVGLTAHSGIVDVRIAAKAGTETEANTMIAQVEKELRTRLGVNIYAADLETLEGVTLDAIEQHGWTLAAVEVNLDNALLDRLSRTGRPAYHGGSSRQVRGDELAAVARSILKEHRAEVALGVALFITGEQQDIFIHIATPAGQVERHLTYGGHPGNARRWAVNMALDLLRRTIQETH